MAYPNPSNTSTNEMLRRALAVFQQGDKAGAMQAASDLIKADNQNADVWYFYALVNENTDLRLKALDRALTINPTHQRALALRAEIDTQDDPFGGLQQAGYRAQSPYAAPGGAAPVINVNVVQTNTQTIGGKRVNGTAFWVGFLVQLFTGIAGISHLVNGKVGGAVGAFIVGSILWPTAAILLSVATLGVCAIAVLPLHIFISYSMSRTGAEITA